jgi:hypothetical protein
MDSSLKLLMNTFVCHVELVSASIFVTYWQCRAIHELPYMDDVHFHFNGCIAAVSASE